jgi:hypothetical protein
LFERSVEEIRLASKTDFKARINSAQRAIMMLTIAIYKMGEETKSLPDIQKVIYGNETPKKLQKGAGSNNPS